MINTLFPYKRYSFINETVLDSLPQDFIDQIEKNKTVLNLKKGQILFHEGSIPTGVYIVKSGKVKKYSTGLNGKEHIFYLIKENGILGHHNLLCDETYSHSAACLTDSMFYLISKEVFLSSIQNNNEMLNRFLNNISHEFGVFMNNSKILAQHNVRERTALCIIKLQEFFQEEGYIKLSRKDHSNIIGTSIESLVRVLHDFKEERLIEVRENTIYVTDTKGLIDAANFI
ncbi:Crp/Fnr family transcriptional regulator [Aquimarina sp. 2201CG5-10]|uniref:Crp/Fnr family transcriptional regulator n=1 Tax=Aquimarina callyspongiae TaxID=3098150 RepID=UPI002AB491E5|nr:Crp/Fnr family transcriptional regulator [Aquimarina sp. 2201CG5-10]MDY8134559.1 Crp/Fnr family transcriptional regulator [Aquimarina sp. 2201CG5-10]